MFQNTCGNVTFLSDYGFGKKWFWLITVWCCFYKVIHTFRLHEYKTHQVVRRVLKYIWYLMKSRRKKLVITMSVCCSDIRNKQPVHFSVVARNKLRGIPRTNLFGAIEFPHLAGFGLELRSEPISHYGSFGLLQKYTLNFMGACAWRKWAGKVNRRVKRI